MHLSIYDYIVIAFYLVFMFCLGPVFKGFSKNASDFFRGGGGMLWWIVGSSSFMMVFTAWTFTGGAAEAYESGTFFLLLFICNLISYVFTYFFTAAKYRQMRIITALEAVHKRFGKTNEQIFTYLYILTNIIFGGVWLYSISVFMTGVFNVNMSALIVLLGITVIGMTVIGGSWAATAGDFVQMLIVIVITVLMALIVLWHPDIGGISGLVDKLPSYHFKWTEITRPSVIVFFAITLLINQIIQSNSLTVGAAKYVFVKSGSDAKKAVAVNIAGFLLLAPVWMIPALAAPLFHPNLAAEYPKLNNPHEAAYVAMAISLLPKGLLGLLVCGVFAATVTTMAGQLNSSSGTFVRNFYIKVINRNASENKQIAIGRIFSLIYGLIWILVALIFGSIKSLALFDLLLLCAAAIGIPTAVPMFFGIFVKKNPSWSAWSTMLIGFLFSFIMQFAIRPESIQRLANVFGSSELLTARELGKLNISITTAVLFVVCIAWLFFTMLFYKKGDKDYVQQTDIFFNEMNTPVNIEKELGAGYENDIRQYKVMAKLCIVYGVFIALLLFIPNDMKARMYIFLCSLIIGGIGVMLYFIALKVAKKHPVFKEDNYA
ncbi:MAG: hypothetical protein A2Y10_08985 [Planctomycetes bacterium GWF2_41_51]|nr:MAG: hypothetical protein A2Y10_08985 [Planctomycetes bacterium GWF2_41_51]